MYWPYLYEDRPRAISWPNLFVRNVSVMANHTWAQGIEHGWVARPARSNGREPVPARRFVLSDWLPSAIAARGGRVTRESERALSDLRAAQDARSTGR